MSRLKERLIAKIDAEGPITVAEYMTLCLLDPVDGYYPTRDPLGSDGDFITAPEISQMFGEVLGLWCIQSWQDMGRPETVQLIEFGPGRGIMMSDILRAARLDHDFIKAVNVTLIEASAALQAVQAKTLADSPCSVSWADDLASGMSFWTVCPFVNLFKRTALPGWQGGERGWSSLKIRNYNTASRQASFQKPSKRHYRKHNQGRKTMIYWRFVRPMRKSLIN